MIGLTRRQILEAFLALPVASAACKRPAPRVFAGEIRGARVDVGHELRKASRAPWPTTPPKKIGTAIVGGGPSGLSAAWRFERLGYADYMVFDLEERAGGTSQFGTDGVVPYPWGAHYVPLPTANNPALVTLLTEMGALEKPKKDGDEPEGREECLIRDPEERLFYMGKWYEGLYPRAGATADDLDELARFQKKIDEFVAKKTSDARRPFSIPLATATEDPAILALDQVPLADWLKEQNLKGDRLRWFVDYGCRDDYGLSLADTSAYAGLFYYASRVNHVGEETQDFLSWPNGNGHIVEHLLSVTAQRVRPSTLVTEIIPGEKDVRLLAWDTRTNSLESYVADEVIFAAPKFTAKHVVRPLPGVTPPWEQSSLDYGAWMVANIHLSGRPETRGFPLAWDNVLYDSPSLGYVVATHQALRDHGPTVLTYYYPLVDHDARKARERLLALTHEEWCHVIVADLRRAHVGLEELIERIDINRWGHAMARPTVGAMKQRLAYTKPYGRIHFAHSDTSSMGLFEEAQHWGVRAAEEILLGRGHPSFGRLT